MLNNKTKNTNRSGKWYYSTGIVFLMIMMSCSNGKKGNHLYNGRLEADIISLSAKTGGTIDTLLVDKGEKISSGQLLAVIDNSRYLAQKRQQAAQLDEIRLSLQGVDAQIRQVKPQLDLARETLLKTQNLYKNGAATQNDVDELSARVDVLQAQLDGLVTNKKVIASRKEQLLAGIEITDLNLSDTQIYSPLNGLVLNTYHHRAETVAPGQKLIDVADLSRMEATIYVALTDLNKIKLGDKARVRIDGSDEFFTGRVAWISSESEFTPKTILTKETRTTLVYAVQINVPNSDGVLKIGMPVDVEMI
ncbi:efflux RND transporter periplasmic adaptor subunit [candidate division KSB1 bacterium]|nr:efflux RND transporter periplasmic adaptor subunit [candidate division KSB1 bacterium]